MAAKAHLSNVLDALVVAQSEIGRLALGSGEAVLVLTHELLLRSELLLDSRDLLTGTCLKLCSSLDSSPLLLGEFGEDGILRSEGVLLTHGGEVAIIGFGFLLGESDKR